LQWAGGGRGLFLIHGDYYLPSRLLEGGKWETAALQILSGERKAWRRKENHLGFIFKKWNLFEKINH
jgi:hypothetical protein